jgi:FG-GAP repeat
MMLPFVIAAIVTLTFAGRAAAAFTQQGEKLTASEEIGAGYFGQAVAVSADGNTALIGESGDNERNGTAWIFTRSGATWTPQAKLTGTGESGKDAFGSSVALSADGDTALVGGPGANAENPSVRAAWIFTRSGSTWTQQGERLTPGGRHPARGKSEFGRSVALSADGNTALVGGSNDHGRKGAALVFSRSGSIWTRHAKLRPSEEQGRGEFGASVALSADGSTALIGGPSDHRLEGAAWVFTLTDRVWTQQGSKLTGACAAERESSGFRGAFGRSVALSADGNTALIGQPLCGVFNCVGPHCVYVGRAYTFGRSGSVWTQLGPSFKPQGGRDNEGFGDSLALSAEGNAALIAEPGGCFEFVACPPGAAWQFARSGETWTQQGEAITGSGEVEHEFASVGFGASVALSSEATTALIGGPGDNDYVGAAWVFVQ